MVMVWAWVAVRPVESTTLRVKLKVPAAVGVPVIAPPDDSDNPGGSVPESTVQVNGVASMMGNGVGRRVVLAAVDSRSGGRVGLALAAVGQRGACNLFRTDDVGSSTG